VTKFLSVIFLSSLLTTALFGQQKLQWFRLDANSGLPTNNVYSSIVDSKGYIWLATDQGAVRYNGYQTKVFNTNNGLPTNDVYKLQEDGQGRIWVYTLSTQFGFIKDEVYQQLKLPYTDKFKYISDICEKGDWVFFSYSANAKADQMFVFYNGNRLNVFKSIGGDPYMAFYVDKENTEVVTHDMNKSLYSFTLKESTNPFKVLTRRKCSMNRNIYHLLINYSTVWYRNKKIYLNAFNSHTIRTINTVNCNFDSLNLLTLSPPDSNIYLSTVHENKILLFSHKHIYRLSDNLRILNRETFPKPFSDVQVSFKMTGGGFEWFSTSTLGIGVMSKHSTPFSQFDELSVLQTASLVGSDSNRTYWWTNSKNWLYVVSQKRIVATYHLPSLIKVSKVQHYEKYQLLIASAKGMHILHTNTEQLAHYGDNFKLVTTYNWHFFNSKDNQTENLPDSLKKMAFAGLFDLHQYSQRTYFAPSFGGLIRYETDLTDSSRLFVSMYEKGRFNRLEYDKLSGLYLLINQEKMKLFNPEKDSFLEIDKNIQRLYGLDNRTDIKFGDGFAYIIKSDRILEIDIRKRSVHCIEDHLNLLNAKSSLRNKKLVVAGNFGVAMFEHKNGITKRTGLALNLKRQLYKSVKDVTLSDENTILCNTDNGLFSLAADSLRITTLNETPGQFQIVVTHPFKDKIRQGDTLRLAKGTHKISFDAINFFGSGQLSYKYKIPGVQDEWKETEQGDITITDLRPGRPYKMWVIVSDELWFGKPMLMTMVIEPYWWQTQIWKFVFWLLGVAVTATLVLTTFVITRKNVLRKNEKRRMQTELELRAIHSQINPHFIFNTLSTALLFISKQQTKDAYEHVNNFSKLLRNYLKSSRERFITLADEIEILKQYIELQQARFSKGFHYKINVADAINSTHVLLPSLLLQPLIENAINHGLFNKKGEGMLIIDFKQGMNDTELICTIDDNGIGRAKARILNKRYKKQKSSYGTELTKDLIDIFRRYEQMDIDLQYLDKTEPETGTTVKLTIRNVKMVNLG